MSSARREAWTCDHQPKCVTLAVHREQGPRREREREANPMHQLRVEGVGVVIEKS